ncbi:hypothetical protein AAFF_G00062390 [Aldrovandia affinis]|uniref:Uncharacterized protein n=1 Tax=Aldrovandia affinis TaxID=143900 RepID=A0AAD7RZR9_9TELE|nr:hypothetical protein AAFF_G00062390 [Aldrovandia affinis]
MRHCPFLTFIERPCAGWRKVNPTRTRPNEYRDRYGEPVNAKGGPLDCPFGNPLCEYGVRGGAGWECHHPRAAQLVNDPRFWAAYADYIPDEEDAERNEKE